MAFNDLLLQVGGAGRFQQIQVTLVVLPLLLMASHNTLQNFTAAVPTHHCRPPADTNLSKDGELDAWLPRDGQGRPESCLRFTSPQRGLPFPNGTETNGTGATEPCTHGWIYDNSTFPSTIVMEAGPPEGAHLELPADGCVRNLRRLCSQLPRLLRLPAPLGHVAGWHFPQLHDTECGVDAHPHAGLRGHPDWLCLQPGPVSPGWCGLCCAPLALPAAAGLRALFCLLHLLLVLHRVGPLVLLLWEAGPHPEGPAKSGLDQWEAGRGGQSKYGGAPGQSAEGADPGQGPGLGRGAAALSCPSPPLPLPLHAVVGPDRQTDGQTDKPRD
ncbi:uncharacterized protein [Globicephala melas]|uniref:uncharacterized protein isoform X2 n=1 Tax=Globicephala melas TaxID=9731 RepID=UPI00293D1D2A|nr:uncharacterized protein LOC132593319 isoform X2 [Globicephala melas]